MPLFSIVLISFNQRAFVAAAIASVRAQTLGDWEIVAVDDGSTDGTLEYLEGEAAGDPRIRVVSLENGGTPGRTRNHGLARVTGEFVSFLDADDLYPPTRLSSYAAAFAAHPGVSVAFGDYLTFETAPDDSMPGWLARQGLSESLLAQAAPVRAGAARLDRRLVLECAMGGSWLWNTLNTVVRRTHVVEAGLRFDETLKNGEDFELLARIVARGEVVFLPQIVGYYRRHPSSITITPGAAAARNDAVVHERLLATLGGMLSSSARARARREAATLRFHAGYRFWRDRQSSRARQQFWRSLRLHPRLETVLALGKTFVPAGLYGPLRR